MPSGLASPPKRLADRMITLGKRGDLHARRQAMRVVHGKGVTAKLFGELAERYATRPGGYTRVLRSRRRVGDAAEMSIVAQPTSSIAAWIEAWLPGTMQVWPNAGEAKTARAVTVTASASRQERRSTFFMAHRSPNGRS